MAKDTPTNCDCEAAASDKRETRLVAVQTKLLWSEYLCHNESDLHWSRGYRTLDEYLQQMRVDEHSQMVGSLSSDVDPMEYAI